MFVRLRALTHKMIVRLHTHAHRVNQLLKHTKCIQEKDNQNVTNNRLLTSTNLIEAAHPPISLNEGPV